MSHIEAAEHTLRRVKGVLSTNMDIASFEDLMLHTLCALTDATLAVAKELEGARLDWRPTLVCERAR